MNINKILLEAIALRRCVVGTYNRMAVTLAPHILYSRGERLFIDAVTIERDGRPPRETKLGTFQLEGLKDVALADPPFKPATLFDPNAGKYAGVTLFAVQ